MLRRIALLLVLCATGCNQKPVAPPINDEQIESLAAILAGVHSNTKAVECAVEDQGTQLDRIESAISELKLPACDNPVCKCVDCPGEGCTCGEVVEPPAEPAPTSEAQELLESYTGAPLPFRGLSGELTRAETVQHLASDHGLSEEELEPFTLEELQLLNGACEPDETTRLMYSTKPRTVTRSIKRVQQRAIRRAPVRIQNCPGGYCPRR